MKAIIDTHVFLWVITAPEKLSQTALQIIESKANDIFLSPVSCWEIVIKYQVKPGDGAPKRINFDQWRRCLTV